MTKFELLNQTPDIASLSGYLASRFSKILKKNYNIILLCFLGTFLWGMLTHAYFFLNGSFSHDSLVEFNAAYVGGNTGKIRLGRIFVPACRFLSRGYIELPWLIGILSLIYIGIAVLLTVKIFEIHSKVLIVLISGIFTTNITVIASAATYLHDFDCNMLALACAALSVFLWKKYKKGFFYGSIPLCISLGLYQSYISVAITLILLYLVIQLLGGERFEIVFKKGIKSICMILCAGILYFIAMKIILYATQLTLASGNYNTMDTILSISAADVIVTAVKGYQKTIDNIFTAASAYPQKLVFVINVIIFAVTGFVFLFRISGKEIKGKEKILTIVLTVLLPFGMNVVYVLTGGMSHDLMHFALWIIYLFVLLISWSAGNWFNAWKPLLGLGPKIVSAFMVVILLWGNVQLGNAVYLRKDLEQRANLSLFTRLVYKMENFDGYVTGQTPVVFVGIPDSMLEPMEGFERTYELVGSNMWYVLGAANRYYYQAYFDYILQNPAVMADEETWSEMQEDSRVTAMPCYPEEGSIAILDGTIVIKLGENND